MPSAVLYGIESWEVAHNRFMHWVLSDPGWGLPFARAMVERSMPTLGFIEAVERAREQVERPVQIDGRQQKGRLDEEVWLRIEGGERIALIIEMKLDALAGARQLSRYVHATRALERVGADADLPARVEGLLLRLTAIPDPAEVEGVGRMNLAGYLSALDALLAEPTPPDARVTRAQLDDYRDLCRWLDAREKAVLDAPWQALRCTHHAADASLERHGAFVRTLLIGAIADGLAGAERSRYGEARDQTSDALADRFGWLGPKIASDPNSVFLDCAVGVQQPLSTALAVGLREPRDGDPEAVGFIKIRVGAAAIHVELQTIIADYPKNKAQIPSRKALTRAWLASDESKRLGDAGWRRVSKTNDRASRWVQRAVLKAEGREDQTAQAVASEVTARVDTLIASVRSWRAGGR